MYSVNHKALICQNVSAFSCISISHLFIDLSSSNIEQFTKRAALEAATRKVLNLKEFADTLVLYFSVIGAVEIAIGIEVSCLVSSMYAPNSAMFIK